MSQPSGLQFTARLGSLPDDTFAVVDFELTEHLSQPFVLTLNLASSFADLAVADVLDQGAELVIWQDGQALRTIQGVVSAFSRGDTGHRRTRYWVEVKPALWRLSLMHNSRIFQQQTPETIIGTLLDERGLVDKTFDLKRSPGEREYCVQHRETDLDFLTRLAAEEGWHYRFDHDTAGQPMVIADHHREAPELPEVGYNALAGGSHKVPCIFKFRYTETVSVAGVALKDYTFRNPAYALMHQSNAADIETHQRTNYEHYDYPGRFKADASGQPYTEARLESLRREASLGHGESNRPDFTTGARFTLGGHTSDSLNRDWLITQVTHKGAQPQALEEEGGSGATTYSNTFQAMPGDRTWRPAPPQRPVMDGPQIAIVTGPAGEEIHCDEHGRVKVRFPWDRYSKNDEHSSAWLRVSQGWAGGSYGFMALPRIGHEVIVSFLEGDPDQPIITGRTYHATNTPPYALPEHKTRTTLKTQTHKGEGSNELRFEDEANQEQIYIHAQKDLDLLTEHDRTEVIHNTSHLTVDKDRYSHIKADDHATVDGEKREKVGKDMSLTVGGSHHSKQGKAQLVQAGSEIHHKAGLKIVVEAGAEITLKAGGNFVKVDPSGVTVSGPMIKMNSGGSPGSGADEIATEPTLPRLVGAAAHGTAETSALAETDQRANATQDTHEAPSLPQHGSRESSKVVPPISLSPTNIDESTPNATEDEKPSEKLVEPGFHIAPRPMTKNELLKSLYGDASAKPDHFDRLNPGIDNRVLSGEMIILGDPEGMACTQEEADLMQVARQVNQQVRTLDEDEAQFLTDHYDLLEMMTSNAATGMGAGAVMISKQIKGIEYTLLELEKLHQTTYSKHGHLNSPDFFSKRKQLFKQLDFALGNIARKGMSLNDNPKLKSALGLSSKSIVHSWKQSGVGGIPGYATHYDKLAKGAKYAKAGGYLAIAMDSGVSGMKIYEACSTGRTQECAKVKYTEGGRLSGSIGGGIFGGAAGAALCGITAVTTGGIGGIACAIIMGGVGSAAGGYAGGTGGEYLGDQLYRHVEDD